MHLRTHHFQHTSQLRRIAKNIMDSREGAMFHSCLVKDDIKEPHIINFEFFINLNGIIPFDKIPIYHTLIDNPIADNRKVVPNRAHHVKIPDFREIVEIRVSKFPGSLNSPWNYSSGYDFTKLSLIP